MATKKFDTRLKLKYGTYAEWTASGAVVLLKGEIGICEIAANTNTSPAGSSNGIKSNAPVIMFKVGDGETAFANLPWASATAADVYSWAKVDYNTFLAQLKSDAGITGDVATQIATALNNYYTKSQIDSKVTELNTAITTAVNGEKSAREAADTQIRTDFAAADAAILGTSADTADKNTVYGAKAAAEAAKTVGEAAQTAADAAQAAADAAQDTADDALAAANKAQGEVDALEGVVATKANASALDNYYTKTAADSKFATITTTNGLRTDVDKNTAAIEALTGTGTGSIAAQVNEAKQAAQGALNAANAAQQHSEGVAEDLGTETTARTNADTALGQRIDGTVTRISALETASATHATKTELNTAKSDLIGTSGDASSANTINAAKKYADEKVAALVNGAPETLDTLDELAAALKDNKDIVTVLENSIATKANQSALDEAVADIAELDKDSHTHANKDELDLIASGDKSKWDTAAGNAHTHTNKTVLDGIDAADITKWDKVTSKADSTTVTAIDTRLTTAEGTLATAVSDISTLKSGKADKTTVEGIAGDLSTLSGTVSDMDAAYKKADSDLNTAIGKKADQTTVSAIDTRVTNLEKIDHDHSNKTVLDGITSTKVSNWDDANTKKHTHDNKTVLDGITSTKVAAWDNVAANAATSAELDAVDARVEALETMTLILDCGGPSTVTHVEA